jgi:hypothetical protein
MSISPAWQKRFDFVGPPIVLQLAHAQIRSDSGLLAIPQFDERVGLTQAFARAFDDPRVPDLARLLLSRASAQTSWQQNGNNTGDVSPM